VPKIFEYFGIIIFFYSNEHDPIHVHAQKGEYETKAEFFLLNGEITEIKLSAVKGRKSLKSGDLRDFKLFLSNYSEKIVEKWVDFFVYHKNVSFEKITTKLS
jgi:hypothetical protein